MTLFLLCFIRCSFTDVSIDNLLLAKEDLHLRGNNIDLSRKSFFPSFFSSLSSSSSSASDDRHKSLLSFFQRTPEAFTPPPVVHHGKDELPHQVPSVIFSSSHIESVAKLQPPMIEPVNVFASIAANSPPRQDGSKAYSLGNLKPAVPSVAAGIEKQNQHLKTVSRANSQQLSNKNNNNMNARKVDNNQVEKESEPSKALALKKTKNGKNGKMSNKSIGITYNSIFYPLDPSDSDGNLVIGKF
jgi:hypothetical protein